MLTSRDTGVAAVAARRLAASRALPATAPERLALTLLAATLGAIYLIGALTSWRTSQGLAATELAIGLAQLAWATSLQLSRRPGPLLSLGALAQLALVALWAYSRTIGLGGAPQPVTALDLICAVDALVIAALAAHQARATAGPTAIWRCQIAAMLAGMTLFTLGAAHHAGPRSSFFGGRPGGHFFCRPL